MSKSTVAIVVVVVQEWMRMRMQMLGLRSSLGRTGMLMPGRGFWGFWGGEYWYSTVELFGKGSKWDGGGVTPLRQPLHKLR